MRMHIAVNALLYSALLAMATLLAVRLDRPFTLGKLSHPLSRRSVEVLSKAGDIECTVVLPRNNVLWPPLRELLENMRDAAKPARFETEFVDPNLDIRESLALAGKYSIEGWTVVFSSGGRVEKVPSSELFERVGASSDVLVGAAPESMRFTGEKACVGAVVRLLRGRAPRLYSLAGEGERDFNSYDEISGYSDFARELVREGCSITPVSGENPIPDDCDVLIVAGPRYAPSATTLSSINDYISRGGRLLLFLDRPEVTPSGWEPLLARLGLAPNGLSLANQMGNAVTAVPCGGAHPVAAGLGSSAVSLTEPQLFDVIGQSVANESDLPRPVPILHAPDGTWGESTPDASPVHFDVGVDRKAPFPIAYSVSSPDEASDLGISKCRAVVIGDSDFASNVFMAGGRTANRDFAMNAVDWVAESFPSGKSSEFADGAALQLQLTGRKLRRFWLKGAVLWPFVIIVAGLFMSRVRRWIA